ncbi:AAA family ATPase [Pseudofrankia sp. DC12]|uniref:AAA family ATPase n=1 Tax=Pseudofrankia sp. DC12 TaxID=683315 RepID=UPI0005F89556|nr:AAA family ATPase [Pseudofrankia sp. DC12]
MRPHRLELVAFGAFPGEVDLDLDRLGAGGLVLLCGETGGGKTTLLDALGFALFGTVPGLRGVRDLRSHHASPDVAPRVRLEYSVPAGRFRVTRSPGWDRPRRRGDGTQRQHPTALLERWTGSGWAPDATRNEDVGLEVNGHLGMRPEQFFQVVMLPQGRFADFLHADNDAREALLKQLFSVGRFERVEQWLADRAKRAADDHGLARQDLDRVHAKVTEAAGRPDAGDATAEAVGSGRGGATDDPPGPDWARALANDAAATAATADRHRDETGQLREQAERALAATREAVRRAEERARLLARLAELDEQAPLVAELATELAAAARAGAVSRAITETLRRGAEATQAEGTQAQARAAAAAAAVAAGDGSAGDRPRVRPDATADELATLAADAHAESGRLERFGLVLDAARDDETQADLADREALGHAQAAAIRETEIATTLPARRRVAQGQADAARRAARLAPALAERSRQLSDLADAVREHRRALAESTDTAASATQARTRAIELRQQRFDAITAELAAALADDTPCPVCGALDHPDPAEVRADHVSKDAEQEAEQEANRREAAAGAARDRVAGLTGRVRTLRAAALRSPAALADDETDRTDASTDETATGRPHQGVGEPGTAGAGEQGPGEDPAAAVAEMLADLRGTLLDEAVLLAADDAPADVAEPDRTAGEIHAAARAFAAAAAQAASGARDLAEAEADLAALVESQTRAHTDLATHRAEERAAGLRAAAARDRAAAARATVPPALRDPARLASQVDAVARFARACTHAEQAVRAAARAHDELRRAEAAATDAATEAGFADPGAALAAVREPVWLADAQARVQAHHDERVETRSRLAAPDPATTDPATTDPAAGDPAAADDPSAHLDRHERAAAAARTAHEQAWASAATAAQRARRLAELVDEFARAHAALAPRRAAAEQLRQLADLTAGRAPANQHGMPLSSYVLAARLEEVAQAASRRLAAMSGGRYTLVHDTGERRDRRRKAGLGLLVVDAWTGRSRPTATLSGGETFQAALSLALGLADVVSTEAGGHAIDTLFVDEGFGTLDPDSLDEVMNVLDELRAGGRLVGVVSHVADLRLRIPTQIQVRKGPSGSTVETTA